MHRTALALAVTFAVGLVALVLLGLAQSSTLVYSVGVNPAVVAAELRGGDRACQAPIRPPTGAEFDRVGFMVVTYSKPGPDVRVDVLDADTRRVLGTGTLPGGYPDQGVEKEHVVPVGTIDTDRPLRVCFTNEDRRKVAIIGQDQVASPPTSATLNGKPLATDLTLNLRAEGRSLLALLPDMADRASRFRAGWIVPPVYFVLGALILIGAPVLLAHGLARAAAADAGR
jgi:hypothetical protein